MREKLEDLLDWVRVYKGRAALAALGTGVVLVVFWFGISALNSSPTTPTTTQPVNYTAAQKTAQYNACLAKLGATGTESAKSPAVRACAIKHGVG